MWQTSRQGFAWAKQFFLINLSHEDLFNHYKTNFQLIQVHNYSLTELDDMIPFEREIYVHLLNNHLEEQRKKQQQG
jgi:hypothetical protein